MNLKTTLSALALTAAFAVTGPAFAQTMINGAAVPEADLPAVQQRCDELKTADDTASLADTKAGDEVVKDAGDAATPDAPLPNEAANATTTVDLDNLTLEACVEAGLSTAM